MRKTKLLPPPVFTFGARWLWICTSLALGLLVIGVQFLTGHRMDALYQPAWLPVVADGKARSRVALSLLDTSYWRAGFVMPSENPPLHDGLDYRACWVVLDDQVVVWSKNADGGPPYECIKSLALAQKLEDMSRDLLSVHHGSVERIPDGSTLTLLVADADGYGTLITSIGAKANEQVPPGRELPIVRSRVPPRTAPPVGDESKFSRDWRSYLMSASEACNAVDSTPFEGEFDFVPVNK
jgi:hypothetical protein